MHKKSGKKKNEAHQLQAEILSDEDWNDALSKPGLLVVDVYARWCGPCTSMIGHLRRVKLELGDDYLTLAVAQSDTIEALSKFRNKPEPTWLFIGSGKPLGVIHGANGPELIRTIRERCKAEKNYIKKGVERPTVLLDSLLKPEETIQPDEDLEDVEGEMAFLEGDEEGQGTPPLHQGVLFILPHIIATDRAETFLSNIVSAGLVISGHIQQELSPMELHDLLVPPVEEEPEEEINEEEKEGEEQEEKEEEKIEEVVKVEEEEKEVEEDLALWEERLLQGPLYMLLLSTDEGGIVDAWYNLLGPVDLECAKMQEPDSLVALFGDEDEVIPAWFPKTRDLQERLIKTFFPPGPDANIPRLLLVKDSNNQQVLSNLCNCGVQVLAHTQLTLTKEKFEELNTGSSSEQLAECVDSDILACVVKGEEVPSAASEVGALHLTMDSTQAESEVTLFFPDIAEDLMNQCQDEPQTQMQLQGKEGEND